MGGLDHLNGLDASAQEKATTADGGIQFDSALAATADHIELDEDNRYILSQSYNLSGFV